MNLFTKLKERYELYKLKKEILKDLAECNVLYIRYYQKYLKDTGVSAADYGEDAQYN